MGFDAQMKSEAVEITDENKAFYERAAARGEGIIRPVDDTPRSTPTETKTKGAKK